VNGPHGAIPGVYIYHPTPLPTTTATTLDEQVGPLDRRIFEADNLTEWLSGDSRSHVPIGKIDVFFLLLLFNLLFFFTLGIPEFLIC